jgi:hypothetical protein
MATTNPYEEHEPPSQVDRADLLRALTVERFTPWSPMTTSEDRDEMVAYPTVRDGLPFEPITRSVRARKYRPNAKASRRSS